MRGYEKSDLRHLHVHRVALERLRDRPDLRDPCLELARRWMRDSAHASARPWLARWCEMLADWPCERIVEVVLDPEHGQTLRQCSSLGPTLTPRERWAALAEANRRIAADDAAAGR